jgi:REP element-mobilizing transposase RayT
MKQFYRRRLPHWQPPSAIIFVTYRLFGSLPIEAVARLGEEKRRLAIMPPRVNESRRDRALREGKRLFAWADDALDATRTGPQWLIGLDVASMLVDNLFHHADHIYRLWAWVIMPNHAHLLFEPLATGIYLKHKPTDENFVALARITHSLKSYIAKRANALLNREGTFWQEESYDHWVRDEKEFERVLAYIENNPVKAGWVNAPEKWKWSSAACERGEDGRCVNCRVV